MSPLVIAFGAAAVVALVLIIAVRATNRRTQVTDGGGSTGYPDYGDRSADYTATGTSDADAANGADDCSSDGSDGGSDGGGDCGSDGGGGDGGGGGD